jgi:hypothetical protein
MEPHKVSPRVRCAIARALGLPPSALIAPVGTATERQRAQAMTVIEQACRAIVLFDDVLLNEPALVGHLRDRVEELRARALDVRDIAAAFFPIDPTC